MQCVFQFLGQLVQLAEFLLFLVAALLAYMLPFLVTALVFTGLWHIFKKSNPPKWTALCKTYCQGVRGAAIAAFVMRVLFDIRCVYLHLTHGASPLTLSFYPIALEFVDVANFLLLVIAGSYSAFRLVAWLVRYQIPSMPWGLSWLKTSIAASLVFLALKWGVLVLN